MLTEDQIQDLIDNNESYSKEYFIWQMDSENGTIEDFFEYYILNDLDERVIAICMEDDVTYADAEYAFQHTWEVYDDSEADALAREYAKDRLEEELYSVPRHLWEYFNDDAYIDDIVDDRGGLLGYVDGAEYTQKVNGTTYYLYKR